MLSLFGDANVTTYVPYRHSSSFLLSSSKCLGSVVSRMLQWLLIISEAFSAIIITAALGLPLTTTRKIIWSRNYVLFEGRRGKKSPIWGMMEASTTRKFWTPLTRSFESTTDPRAQVPTGWYIVMVKWRTKHSQYESLRNFWFWQCGKGWLARL